MIAGRVQRFSDMVLTPAPGSENRQIERAESGHDTAMSTCTFLIEHVSTPIGVALIATDPEGRVRALDWEDHRARMDRLLRIHYGAARVALAERDAPSGARRAVERYFAGEIHAIDGLRVETHGTTFQRLVWTALRSIPPGQTLSYGNLAVRIGRPAAVRAVGLANGANPVGLIVPCHRVVGADRSLTGYGGGLERKRWLLAHEHGMGNVKREMGNGRTTSDAAK